MLDDLLDLLDLTGEAVPSLFGAAGKGKRNRRPAGDPGRPMVETKGKLTARRTKHQGEDPWDWKEEKPPWEL